MARRSSSSRNSPTRPKGRGVQARPSRRNYWIFGGAGAVLLIGLIVALVLTSAPATIAGVTTFSDLERDHQQGTVAYEQIPPVAARTIRPGRTVVDMISRLATNMRFIRWSTALSGLRISLSFPPIKSNSFAISFADDHTHCCRRTRICPRLFLPLPGASRCRSTMQAIHGLASF